MKLESRFRVLLIAVMAFLMFFCMFRVFAVEFVPMGEVDVRLYVIALDGVAARGVENVARAVNGVLSACRANDTTCLIELYPPLVLGVVKISTNAIVISNWSEYKAVVESEANAIIVNIHGETLPVPSGYTREAWVDKIAEAMLYRRVSWVHTAGYPFYYVWLQDSGEYTWGEAGFQRLMSHIGKPNVTCYSPWPETELVMMGEGVTFSVSDGWPMVFKASDVERGKPLNATEFKDRLELVIWGTDDSYLTGALIRFNSNNKGNSFGYYVHVGTRKTFDEDCEMTDGDYYRSYVGAAVALWACVWRSAAEKAVSMAEAAIFRAESEGRTSGLETAKKLLQRAKDCLTTRGKSEILSTYRSKDNYWGTVIIRATEAVDAANNAETPTFMEAYGLPLAILGMTSVIIITPLATRKINNTKK